MMTEAEYNYFLLIKTVNEVSVENTIIVFLTAPQFLFFHAETFT